MSLAHMIMNYTVSHKNGANLVLSVT